MKKLFAVLLAAAMMTAMFAGCGISNGSTAAGSTAEASAATSAEPSAAASAAATASAAETAAEATGEEMASTVTAATTAANVDFTWNGQKEVWSVLPTTNAEGLVKINDYMGDILKEDGWTYVKKDSEGDPNNQVVFMEDAIASGTVGAIMCAAMSVEMLKDVAKEAADAGIIVVYLGAQPSDYSVAGCVYTAYEITGYYAIEMAEAWLKYREGEGQEFEKNADGKVGIGLDTYDDIQDGQYRSNAMRDRTSESETLYCINEVTTYGDDAQNNGYNWAENVMTSNPGTRIFICYEPDCMIGVVSFLNQYCDSNSLDKAEFCVIPCYSDETTYAYETEAEKDQSSTTFKGYVTYGDKGDPDTYGDWASAQATGAHLADEILGVANGSWTYGETYYDTINAVSSFGYSATWSMGDPNPAEQYKY